MDDAIVKGYQPLTSAKKIKKGILLLCLGYLSTSSATEHASFLVTDRDLQEMSRYEHILETPSFFTRVYPEHLNPNLVLINRINRGFLFGLTGYFQRLFNDQLDYTISDPMLSPLVSPQSTIHALNPRRDFAYGAYVGYLFPYTDRDIRLDVFNFSNNHSDRVQAPIGGTLWTPLSLYDQTVQARGASSKLRLNLQQAKLMIGQQIQGGTRFFLHSALGVKYAGINQELKTTYLNAQVPPFSSILGDAFIEQRSQFNGVGPAVQFDARYFFAPELALTGHMTTAIMIGSMRSHLHYFDTNSPIPGTGEITYRSFDQARFNRSLPNRAVPNLDGQLGLLFHHPFCGRPMSLDIELGYEFNHFFDAIDNYRSTGLNFLSPFHVKYVHDFTLDGPYFSVGLTGLSCPTNVAIDPSLITVPRLKGGFIFGVGASFMQVAHNQMDYALLDSSPLLVPFPEPPDFIVQPSNNTRLRNAGNNFNFGGSLTLGYIFDDSPYDVQFHFHEIQNSNHNRLRPSPAETIWTILSTPLLSPLTFNRTLAREAEGKVTFNYFDGSLEAGQSISADCFWFRLFEGLQFASIRNNLRTIYRDVTPAIIPSPIVFPREEIVQRTTFTGVGPRLGFDMTVPLSGFALSSELAGGVLLGSSRSSYSDHFFTFIVPGDEIDREKLGTQLKTHIETSPFINLKLGLAYSWNFMDRTKLTLDVGYMAFHYFNAATTFRHATNSSAIFIKQVHDITVAGPYINLTAFGLGACPTDCIVRTPYTAFAPVLRGGFEFAIEGLYLQPQAETFDYGIADPTPVTPLLLPPGILPFEPSSNSSIHHLSTQNKWGYRLHAGYIFTLSANDISINYTWFEQSTNQTTRVPAGGVFWTITNGNLVASNAFPVIANHAEASAHFMWETANIEAGRRLKFYNLMTRFFAGVAYARVKEDRRITYRDGFSAILNSADNLIPITEDILTQENSFAGFGPRLGLTSDLAIACGLSLTGQIATDLLAGNIRSRLNETASTGASTALNPNRRSRLVPAIDGKLGLAYTFSLRNCAEAGLELGYQVNHYFNVKNNLQFTDNFSTFIKQGQSISFNGPYVRLQANL
jgi:Legionella pneumophila major outer membrane protein precursor